MLLSVLISLDKHVICVIISLKSLDKLVICVIISLKSLDKLVICVIISLKSLDKLVINLSYVLLSVTISLDKVYMYLWTFSSPLLYKAF